MLGFCPGDVSVFLQCDICALLFASRYAILVLHSTLSYKRGINMEKLGALVEEITYEGQPSSVYFGLPLYEKVDLQAMIEEA